MRNSKGQFIKGHIPWSKSQKGIHLSFKTEFKKGHIPWIKGKKHSKKSKQKMSENQRGKRTGAENNMWKGGKVSFNCKFCNIEFEMHPYYKNKRFFCSKKCYSQWQKGKRGNKWKGGKMVDKDGYILIRKPNHPFAKLSGYIYEHRLVAEKKLNRYLTKQEVIHHINGIKNDNRPKNLYLFSSHGKHFSYHITAIRKELKSNLSE